MATAKTDSANRPGTPDTREHSHELEIAASPDEVWQAITEAAALVNWCPLDAEAEPGEGGHITYGWGDALRNACRIHVWQPGRHLRTGWLEHPGQTSPEPGVGEAEPIAVDWLLEGTGGGTRLRLVHSGFGPGARWDDEFDGTRRGWEFELYSLKHYLEHHRGKRRAAFWLRRPVADAADVVWKRMVGPAGLVRVQATQLAAGDAVEFTLATSRPVGGLGDRIEGRMVQYLPPTDFACTAANLNNGLFRAGFEKCAGGPEAMLWFSLWDYPAAETAALRRRCDDALAMAFG